MTRNAIAADAVGTAFPVLLGGTAAQAAGADPTAVIVAATFAVAVLAASMGPGRLAGAHLTPVLSFGLYLTGRVGSCAFLAHVVAQALGLGLAAAVVGLVASL